MMMAQDIKYIEDRGKGRWSLLLNPDLCFLDFHNYSRIIYYTVNALDVDFLDSP